MHTRTARKCLTPCRLEGEEVEVGVVLLTETVLPPEGASANLDKICPQSVVACMPLATQTNTLQSMSPLILGVWGTK